MSNCRTHWSCKRIFLVCLYCVYCLSINTYIYIYTYIHIICVCVYVYALVITYVYVCRCLYVHHVFHISECTNQLEPNFFLVDWPTSPLTNQHSCSNSCSKYGNTWAEAMGHGLLTSLKRWGVRLQRTSLALVENLHVCPSWWGKRIYYHLWLIYNWGNFLDLLNISWTWASLKCIKTSAIVLHILVVVALCIEECIKMCNVVSPIINHPINQRCVVILHSIFPNRYIPNNKPLLGMVY